MTGQVRALHAPEIAALRRRLEGAERAAYRLAEIDAALGGLEVLRGKGGAHPLPGAELLDDVDPDGTLEQHLVRLLDLRSPLADRAGEFPQLLSQLHTLHGEQRADLDRAENRDQRDAIQTLTERVERLAAVHEPYAQRQKVLEQLLATLPALIARMGPDGGPADWEVHVVREVAEVLRVADVAPPEEGDGIDALQRRLTDVLGETSEVARAQRLELDRLTADLRRWTG